MFVSEDTILNNTEVILEKTKSHFYECSPLTSFSIDQRIEKLGVRTFAEPTIVF